MVIGSASLRDTTQEVRTVADLKHYRDAAGHVFSMTEAHATKLGYTLVEGQEQPAQAPAEAPAEGVDPDREQAQQDETGSPGAAARTAIERGASGESVVVHGTGARPEPPNGGRRR